MSSVSGPTRLSCASMVICGFICRIAAAAVSDLALVTSHGRKRNCRLRFDFSMVSGSVTTTLPPSPAPRPIIAQFLTISQPMAPAPTSMYLSRPSCSCVFQPNTHACAS